MKAGNVLYALILFYCTACSTARTSFIDKKYPADKLKEDCSIFRGALEESHPSLYWFTSRDSVNTLFDEVYKSIQDSMTERQFRTKLLKVVAGIRCGHTTVNY